MGFGGIDFAPQPAPGSNPFEPLVQGVSLGFGIQQQLREQKRFEQEQLAAQQQAKLNKEKLEMERGQKGIDLLTNPKLGKYLSNETKTQVLRDSVVPFANKAYGLDIDPSGVEYRDDYENLLQLVKNGAPQEIVKQEYLRAVSLSDKETLPVIKEMGDIIGFGQTNNDGITPRQQRMEAGKLRIEFLNRPEVKEFVTIETQVKSMDSLLNKALAGDTKNKLALDQALISMFNKLTDPNSVVRESEYARTPENLPVVNRIIGGITKLQQGGAGLTDEDRKALVVGAKAIANERGNIFNTRRNEYKSLASDLGIDPSVVTRTVQEFKPYEVGDRKSDSSNIPKVNTQAEYDKLPSGAEYIDSDGVRARKR